MDILTRDDIRSLAEAEHSGPVVSLYLPTNPANAGKDDADVLQYKNLVKKVEEGLLAGGMRSTEVTALLLPFKVLYEDTLFWRSTGSGLAVLGDADEFKVLRLPGPVGPSAMVATQYVLKPLLPFVDHDERFYVLALSLNSVRLLTGTRFTVAPLEVADIPQSLADALKWDEYEKEMQFFSGRTGASDMYGQYNTSSSADAHKGEIARYFRCVDDGVKEMLDSHPQHMPLVLAGVEYLLPIYRDQSRYNALAEKGITGNQDMAKDAELHSKAWAIVGPGFESARRKALDRFGELAGTGKASDQLDAIVPAAQAGRVATLFLDMRADAWGKPGVDGAAPEVHETAQPGDTELWNVAATQTMLTGGDVWGIDPEADPDVAPAVAVFRY
jgi:hypothetical protein